MWGKLLFFTKGLQNGHFRLDSYHNCHNKQKLRHSFMAAEVSAPACLASFRRSDQCFVLTQVLEWDFLKWSSVCLAAVAGVSDRKRRGVLAFIARFFRFPLCLLSVFSFCLLAYACKCRLFREVRWVIPTASLPAATSPRNECYLAGGSEAFA